MSISITVSHLWLWSIEMSRPSADTAFQIRLWVIQAQVEILAPPLVVMCSKSSEFTCPCLSSLICRRWIIISTYFMSWLRWRSPIAVPDTHQGSTKGRWIIKPGHSKYIYFNKPAPMPALDASSSPLLCAPFVTSLVLPLWHLFLQMERQSRDPARCQNHRIADHNYAAQSKHLLR